MPFHLTQRRPWKYASAKGLKDDIAKGSADKLGLNDEKSDCSFQLWLKQQHQAHVEFGLDSIFLMPSSDWSKETNIFFDHTLKPETIQSWTQQLLHGVQSTKNHVTIRHPACPYDKQNLTFSRTFLLASVTSRFRQEIQNSVGLDATGIDVFLCILRRKLHLVISLQRELIAKLEALDITQEPGENIPSFNIKVKELCEAIEQSGPTPQDLNLLVMKTFLKSQVQLFSTSIGGKYLELQINPSKHPWRKTLFDNDALYHQLKHL